MTSLLTLSSILFSPINRKRSLLQLQSSTIHRKRATKSRVSWCLPASMAGETSNTKGVVLLDFWVSPFGQRCRIALAEKGLPYDYSEQELLGTKSDLLLRSNPVHKKIPVLLHAGRAVCESLVILEYLDDAFPDAPPLLPSKADDPYARAQARFWAAYSDKVYETGTRLWKLKGDAAALAREDMLQVLRNLDAELGGKPFFAGEAFGFVDVALVPFVPWLPSYERCGGFRVAEVAPGLAAWGARCAERESVAGSLHPAEKVDGFITLLKKHYGIA